MVKVREDMAGWIMAEHGVLDSRLTVIKQTEDYVSPKGVHYARWLCECNCKEHNRIVASGDSLKHGTILSCGCLQKERVSITNKKYNKWIEEVFEDEHGKYRIGFTSNTNKEFYIDADDYDKVKNYCWLEDIGKFDYHSLIAYDPKSQKNIKMCYIFGCKRYDHADRNPLNNRKYNLRIATSAENTRNRGFLKNNTSGFTGVWWDKSKQRWQALIIINKKKKHLGYFINKEDAIKARLIAEKEYFGEFAPQRHLFEQYEII